jgi:hypothetical protein
MKCKKPNCQNEALEGASLCIICAVQTEEFSGVLSSGWTSPSGESAESSDNQSSANEASTPLEQLRKIRTTLNSLATEPCADVEKVKKELAAAVKHLDGILESLQHSGYQASWGVQQAVLDGDLERERRRIEPIKPANPDGPHRIIWKENIGF